MVSVGQPSITVIIIFKCSNKGKTKGKLLRTALVVEQKENDFSRPTFHHRHHHLQVHQ
jgi:hypothetical protein